MAEAEDTSVPASRLRELVLKAVSACTERKGISFYALKMALASEGYSFKLHILKRSVTCLVKHGELIQLGNKCGLNGRFKVPKPEKGSKKKVRAKKCSVEKKKKEPSEKKEPKKPKKPRKPKNSVVVTLE